MQNAGNDAPWKYMPSHGDLRSARARVRITEIACGALSRFCPTYPAISSDFRFRPTRKTALPQGCFVRSRARARVRARAKEFFLKNNAIGRLLFFDRFLRTKLRTDRVASKNSRSYCVMYSLHETYDDNNNSNKIYRCEYKSRNKYN